MYIMAHPDFIACSFTENSIDQKRVNNRSSEKEILYVLEITCNPSIYTTAHPDFIVCRFMENSIGLKRVNNQREKEIQYFFGNYNL